MHPPLLYTGVGGSWSPHVPWLDALISQRLAMRGYQGTRVGPRSLHASAKRDQAQQYARNGCLSSVHTVTITPGSHVTWAPQVGDLVLDMQSMLSDLYWSNSVPDCPILQDTHGDADTIDTYLSMGRAKTRITRLVERYLGVTPVEEFTLAPGQDPFERLGTHMGEVWITGSWTLTPLPTHLIQDAQAFQTA